LTKKDIVFPDNLPFPLGGLTIAQPESIVKMVNPVRNSSPAIAGLETERGIISNGVKGNNQYPLKNLSTNEKGMFL